MTRLILTILMLFPMVELSANNIYWENMSLQEKDDVLHRDSVPKIVLDIYNGKYQLKDDDANWENLDYLIMPTPDSLLRAFKFHSFNKLLLKSDGAVLEAMGTYVYSLFLSDPDYILCYLDKHPDIRNLYILDIGFELYCQNPEQASSTPFLQFKNSALDKTGDGDKALVERFLFDLENKVNELSDTPTELVISNQSYVQDSIESPANIQTLQTEQVGNVAPIIIDETHEKSLWQRIVDWFRNLWNKIFD